MSGLISFLCFNLDRYRNENGTKGWWGGGSKFFEEIKLWSFIYIYVKTPNKKYLYLFASLRTPWEISLLPNSHTVGFCFPSPFSEMTSYHNILLEFVLFKFPNYNQGQSEKSILIYERVFVTDHMPAFWSCSLINLNEFLFACFSIYLSFKSVNDLWFPSMWLVIFIISWYFPRNHDHLYLYSLL